MVALILISLLSAIDCVEGTPQEVLDEHGILTEFTIAPNEHGQCLPHGEWNEFYTNPRRPRTKSTYSYGTITGSFEMWFESGWKSKSGQFDKNGLETGLWVLYHRNGEHWQAGTYRKGKQDGLWISWYQNGVQQSETMWKAGKLHGRITIWHSNGRKAVEGMHENGNPRGVWKWWNADGKFSKTEDFK